LSLKHMSKLLKIGIVGCGAIGSSLAKIIARELKRRAGISALYDIDAQKSVRLSQAVCGNKELAVPGLEQLIARSDLVIEAASAKSSWKIAQGALRRKRSIMVMSVGGLLSRLKELSFLAARYGGKVYIPSGAIAGIDALKAAGAGKIRKVVLTTRKNPLSFKGVEYIKRRGLRLDNIRQEKRLFFGSARQAVKYFPQNINVAAVLSMAGIGEDRTRVEIIASPKVKQNVHEIRIEGAAGKVFTRTENILHPDNPKTSYLAVLAAAATLRQILEPVRIGT